MKDEIETIIKDELRMHSYYVSDSCIDSMVERIVGLLEENSGVTDDVY